MSPQKKNDPQRVNILLVDDQPGKLLTYEAILEPLGQSLIKTTSATEALSVLLKTDVAVVLLDVCMPDMDGFDLAGMIRKHPRLQDTAIILVSGVHMSDLDRLRGYDMGAVDYVPVPIVPELLRAKVRVFVDLFQKTRQLAQLNRGLEQVVEERTTELRRSNDDLQQFAYIASHDLQEPLRMISSFVQMLANRYRGKMDADADEFIQFAVDGAQRMHELIRDLLAYSRVDTARGEHVRADCNRALSRALEDVRLAMRETGAVVTRSDLPTVPGDEVRIGQVFQNLIGNAIKFRKKDVPPEIHVDAVERGGEWIFSVRDNGIGIEPAFRERIFQIFQRLHVREEYPGTGIGLAICKKIVARHDGRIWVESVPGEGSVFYFTLPASGAARRASADVEDPVAHVAQPVE